MIAAVVVVMDQATKIAIAGWLGEVGAGVTVTSFFNLVFALNRGASFGLFNTGSPWGPWLLSGFTVVVVIGLVVWLIRTTERGLGIALGLLIGGAIGNLIDRFRLGHVTDFIDIGPWPIFNIADSSIVIGIGLMLFYFWFLEDKPNKKAETTGIAQVEAGAARAAAGPVTEPDLGTPE